MQWRCDKCGHLGALSKDALLWGSGSTVPRLRCERCGLTSVFGGGQIVAGDDVPPDQEPASSPEAPPERGLAEGFGVTLIVAMPFTWLTSNAMTIKATVFGGYVDIAARLAFGTNGVAAALVIGGIAWIALSRASASVPARAWWTVVHVPILLLAAITACASIYLAADIKDGTEVTLPVVLFPFSSLLVAGALWAVYALGLWITAPTARATTR
jgi:hypothetical protein